MVQKHFLFQILNTTQTLQQHITNKALHMYFIIFTIPHLQDVNFWWPEII